MADDSRPRAPVETIVLLALAGFFYAAMLGSLSDAPDSDAAGRGIALAYAAILAGLLWVVLAVLLIVALAKGRMPLWATLGLVVLWPTSCVAVWMAGDAYGRGDSWAMLVPALLPPLLALYALWARLPALHATFRAVPTSAVLGAAIAILTAMPLVATTRTNPPDPARDARLAEAAKAEEERRAQQAKAARDREEAQFASLGPDSSLESYLTYLHSSATSDRAVAGMRQVKSRQADAIALLQKGRLLDLWELQQLDLAPTADLCQAYGDALAGAAGRVTKARTDYLTAAIELEGQLPNIRWLVGNHCDLAPALGLLETNVRAVADSSRMTKFADALAALRSTRP
jgi:hypothetical protein